MNDERLLEDPINRVVAVFDNEQNLESARHDLLKEGITAEQIRVMQGEQDAKRVDTSTKWFADTDEEIQRYQDELRAGSTVVSLPVTDEVGREKLHSILKRNEARLITHFGQWVTEMMK